MFCGCQGGPHCYNEHTIDDAQHQHVDLQDDEDEDDEVNEDNDED